MKIIVLLSGHGSNLQAIIDNGIPIHAVLSDQPTAYGLQRAKNAHIATEVIDHKQILKHLKSYHPDLIVLAGYMRILPKDVVEAFAETIINIHPSLLPKYKGLNTHERVLEAGDKKHGCTVHIVTAELDAGPVLGQSTLTVHDNDTPETLKKRVQQLEHHLFPSIIREIMEKTIDYEI